MNRQAIRNRIRFLINQLTELPEGSFKDEDADIYDINEVINVAQLNVYLRLVQKVPEEFRKSFNISTVVAKGEYDIVTDLSVTDFWRMENIYHNESAKPPHGLLYLELDQMPELALNVGETGVNPKFWFWYSRQVIGIRPIPSSAVADRLKAYYFYSIPDLNHDTSDTSPNVATPLLPAVAHPLIAIDAVAQLQIADEEGALEVMKWQQIEEKKVFSLLDIKPSIATDKRFPLSQITR